MRVRAWCMAMYMRLVVLTTVVWVDHEHGIIPPGKPELFLFWHECAFSMILLKRFRENTSRVVVAHTDMTLYWEKLLSYLGISTVFSGNPIWLKQLARKNDSFFMAYDGPFGPARKKNEQVHAAIEKLEIPAVFVHCQCSLKINMWKGVQRYTLPLPFGSIRFSLVALKEMQNNI